MPVLHTAQNKLHSVDSESKHKHRLTGKFPGWNLSRRWNNLRGTTSRESQLQQWLQTPSPPLPGFVPKDRRTHLNSNILSIFMVKLIQYWGNDNHIAVCETKASQIRYYERWHDPRLSSHHASEQINQSRSFLSSSVWFICFKTNHNVSDISVPAVMKTFGFIQAKLAHEMCVFISVGVKSSLSPLLPPELIFELLPSCSNTFIRHVDSQEVY